MTDEVQVRRATLDDTLAICALFRGRIGVWQRLDAQGRVQDVPYESLTIYERWLHGGPWMSVETSAIALNHLLGGAGLPLVVEVDGDVRAYAEAYPGIEPEPFGKHLHLAQRAGDSQYDGTLVQALIDHARDNGFRRVTTAFSAYDSDSAAFFAQYGMGALDAVSRFTIQAQPGQGFYKAVPHDNPDYAQVRGWSMTIGRTQSGRQHWEAVWPRHWDTIPEIAAQRTHRLDFNAAGQQALICCRQQLYEPRTVDVYCWSPRALTAQLLTALRDWAYREGYRTLSLDLPETVLQALKVEGEALPYRQQIYGVSV